MNRSSTIATALTLLLSAPLVAHAGQGSGPGDGTGPVSPITTAPCGPISGTVAETGTAGSGYVIDTGTELLTVFGVGPAKYWDSLEIALPDVGESISTNVCWVSFSDGTSKAVATSVTLSDGVTIALRDESTGQPAWRGGFGSGQGTGPGGGQTGGQGPGDCTAMR